jgi:hypothetical protein
MTLCGVAPAAMTTLELNWRRCRPARGDGARLPLAVREETMAFAEEIAVYETRFGKIV